MPTMLNLEQFLPADAPLLDYLVHDTRRPEGWKYPKLKDLESYQSNRGLNLGMLKEIVVRELVCGCALRRRLLQPVNGLRGCMIWIRVLSPLTISRLSSDYYTPMHLY